MLGGACRELLIDYEIKFRRLLVNELLFIRLRHIMKHRKLEDDEAHINLMKSFQRAIDLEIAELHKLQSEINRMI